MTISTIATESQRLPDSRDFAHIFGEYKQNIVSQLRRGDKESAFFSIRMLIMNHLINRNRRKEGASFLVDLICSDLITMNDLREALTGSNCEIVAEVDSIISGFSEEKRDRHALYGPQPAIVASDSRLPDCKIMSELVDEERSRAFVDLASRAVAMVARLRNELCDLNLAIPKICVGPSDQSATDFFKNHGQAAEGAPAMYIIAQKVIILNGYRLLYESPATVFFCVIHEAVHHFFPVVSVNRVSSSAPIRELVCDCLAHMATSKVYPEARLDNRALTYLNSVCGCIGITLEELIKAVLLSPLRIVEALFGPVSLDSISLMELILLKIPGRPDEVMEKFPPEFFGGIASMSKENLFQSYVPPTSYRLLEEISFDQVGTEYNGKVAALDGILEEIGLLVEYDGGSHQQKVKQEIICELAQIMDRNGSGLLEISHDKVGELRDRLIKAGQVDQQNTTLLFQQLDATHKSPVEPGEEREARRKSGWFNKKSRSS